MTKKWLSQYITATTNMLISKSQKGKIRKQNCFKRNTVFICTFFYFIIITVLTIYTVVVCIYTLHYIKYM